MLSFRQMVSDPNFLQIPITYSIHLNMEEVREIGQKDRGDK